MPPSHPLPRGSCILLVGRRELPWIPHFIFILYPPPLHLRRFRRAAWSWRRQDRTARHQGRDATPQRIGRRETFRPGSISTGRGKLCRVGMVQTKYRARNGAISNCSASVAACTTGIGTQNLAVHAAAALSTIVHTNCTHVRHAARPPRHSTMACRRRTRQHTGTSGRARSDNETTKAQKSHGT